MSQESVSSVGRPGVENRSFGRVYENVGEVLRYQSEMSRRLMDRVAEAEQTGRRRVVIRAQVTKDFHPHAMADVDFNNLSNSIEATIPLKMIDPGNDDRIIYVAKNMYQSSVPTWKGFYDDWSESLPPEITPLQRARRVNRGFDLVRQFDEQDYDDLMQIWRPFGWTRAGVTELLEERLRGGEQVWFSGVVERSTNRLVSACMAEMGQVGNTTLVETTEYGTLPDQEYRGQGLCTAAVSFLDAQVLGDLYYSNPERRQIGDISLPLIYAELSLSSRSDRVARNAGYDIPLREEFSPDFPSQVLRQNVAVRDDLEPNDLDLRDVDPRYHALMGTDFPYYRDFVPGVLPLSSVERYYSLRQTQDILRLGGRRTNAGY